MHALPRRAQFPLAPLSVRARCCVMAPWMDADSTVLIHVMTKLNRRYDYGLNMFLLSVDEGITGYRDDSLEVSADEKQRTGLRASTHALPPPILHA